MTRRERAASFFKSPKFRRVVAIVVGAALGASCPLWPERVRPVCAAVAAAIRGDVASLVGQ